MKPPSIKHRKYYSETKGLPSHFRTIKFSTTSSTYSNGPGYLSKQNLALNCFYHISPISGVLIVWCGSLIAVPKSISS